MPRLTKCQKHLRKAHEVKTKHQYAKSDINTQVNIDVSESYPNINDTYFHNELKGYDDVKDLDIDNTFFYNDDNFSVHNEPLEINNAISIETQAALKEKRISNNSNNKVRNYNWNNKILDALKSMELDIKNEKTNSEVWVRLNSICLYLQFIKCNHPKMKASEIVANVAGKEIYHAKCIRS
ncbi:17206_t:CDS:2 [Funneliformis caledonium]|uniref:17206_t:CDS:1 n=1 Tax=Funneliformis caledonium TaxID=1117310 RepID=A0A9N9GQM4_9GLOM|nr:17206_t:CDS:2 [Funneliformis caledonium]